MKLAALWSVPVLGCVVMGMGVSAGCGDDDDVGSVADAGSSGAAAYDPCAVDASGLTAPRSTGTCEGLVEERPHYGGLHVAQGSEIACNENPPSSGPHYPVWAAYQTFSTPVPRGNYVHDLEHGAIVLAYRCDLLDAGCSDVVASLEAVRASLPTDPECDPAIRVRVVITPDPLLPKAVAAMSWGWRYTADCVDVASLEDFAQKHYGQGTEDLCANGTYTGP